MVGPRHAALAERRLCTGTYRWTVGGKPAAFVQQRNRVTGLPTCTFAFTRFAALAALTA